jgi:DUF2917 family protein
MKLIVNNSALVLDRWQTVELVDAAGATAVVDQGCVWITMESDRRDVVLGTGQSFEVDRNGKTLLHAEAPSTLRIVEAPARDALKRLWAKAREAIDGWAIREIERHRPLPYY